MKIFDLPIVDDQLYQGAREVMELSKCSKFVEPFCGNTSLFLNLSKTFDKVIINDSSKDVVRVLKSFRDAPHDQLVKMYSDVEEEFGNIGMVGGAMGAFMKSYQDKYKSDKMVERGLFLYVASTPNCISIDDYSAAQNTLKDSIIYCEGFEKIIDIYDDKDVLFFFNPPYILEGGIFDCDAFIKSFSQIKGNIMFVDVYEKETMKKLNEATGKKWHRRTNKMNNFKETIYYNF